MSQEKRHLKRMRFGLRTKIFGLCIFLVLIAGASFAFMGIAYINRSQDP